MTRTETIHGRYPRIAASELTESTGIGQVDDFLYCLANTLQIAVGDSLRAFFLIGSYAHGGVAPDSDMDYCLIWKEGSDPDIHRKGLGICAHFAQLTGHELEPMYNWVETPFYDPADHGDAYDRFYCGPVLKLAVKEHSLLLCGEDIRPRIALAGEQDMLEHVLDAPINFIKQAHVKPADGSCPLDHKFTHPLTDPDPDQADRGFGDAHRVALRVIHLGRALVFLKTGEFVFNKMSVPAAFEKHLDGPWVDLVRDTFEVRYGSLPDDVKERRLMSIYPRITAFENYFLGRLMARGIDLADHMEKPGDRQPRNLEPVTRNHDRIVHDGR